MYLVKRVPAYSKNITKQVVKQRKLYFTDTGLAAYLLNITENRIINRGTDFFGNILENYVFTELAKENSYADDKIRIYHYRNLRKKEVNFILESSDNKVIAVEVKAKSEIKPKDLSGILSFAQNFSGKVFRGLVFYSGRDFMPIANNAGLSIFLAPLKMLI